MWEYDIELNGNIVGDNGDLEFCTKEEALADADDYIISTLENEHHAKYKDFVVTIYECNV